MTRIKKCISIVLLCLLLVLATSFVLCDGFTFAKAQTSEEDSSVITIENYDGQAMPYGAFTSLELKIKGENGFIITTAKNSFTLFPANVKVLLELYSSDTYQESYTNMKLVNSAYIDDLNIGKSITVKSPTNGVQKYWKGRMYYKIDSKDWQEKVTKTLLYNADGVIVK